MSICSSYAKNCQKVTYDGEISTKKGSTSSEKLKNRINSKKKIPFIWDFPYYEDICGACMSIFLKSSYWWTIAIISHLAVIFWYMVDNCHHMSLLWHFLTLCIIFCKPYLVNLDILVHFIQYMSTACKYGQIGIKKRKWYFIKL